tara:strand:- start:154 stop:369 length:216 start_codon:yes stop_codon:yes gene_type:complete
MNTKQAKQVLKNAGYCVENLLHVSDVTDNYHCTESQASEVLSEALSNQWITEQMWAVVTDEAERLEYKNKD